MSVSIYFCREHFILNVIYLLIYQQIETRSSVKIECKLCIEYIFFNINLDDDLLIFFFDICEVNCATYFLQINFYQLL